MRTIVCVPALNEERTIRGVVRSLRQHCDEVLVIDDGSSDRTGVFAREEGAVVYSHLINRGLGGALATGIAAALDHGADIVVTFDADGQHRAEDVDRLIAPIREGRADFVIGSRFLVRYPMPAIRRIYNAFGNLLTYSLFGIRTTDSQSGLRAFTRAAARSLSIRTNRMEVSSEIMKEAALHHLRVAEVAIPPVYTRYSLSKGQNFIVGLKTAARLILLRLMK